MPIIAVLATFVVCCGFGAAILKLARIDDLDERDFVAWSFALGFAALGWLMFIFGTVWAFGRPAFAGCIVAGLAALVWTRERWRPVFRATMPQMRAPIPWWPVLMIVALFIICFDIFEAWAPPTDADSLTYHFALPKRFLEQGRITFEPRVGNGGVPLLTEMTHILPLALGGERAMTFWAMLSGWMAGFTVYAFARAFLGRAWSAAVALVFLSTPAVVYGAGSGQVEVRIALFVMAATFFLLRGLDDGRWRWFVLAGMAAGAYVGSKYFGLLFAAVMALTILLYTRRIGSVAVFSIGALAVGAEWYLWNWVNAGDPIWPMLYEVLGVRDTSIWNDSYQSFFRARFLDVQRAIGVGPVGAVIYPFAATFDGSPKLEAGRTGFGPLAVLLLPWAAMAAMRCRTSIFRSRLFVVFMTAAGFYIAWFFVGSPQRVRHLLPVYPLLLVALTAAAAQVADHGLGRRPLQLAFALTLGIQLAGTALFGATFVRYVLGPETRDQFLARMIEGYSGIPRVNAVVGPRERVLSPIPNLSYYFEVPYFFADIWLQALIDIRPDTSDISKFIRQLAAQGITHLLVDARWAETSEPGGLTGLTRQLVAGRCAHSVFAFDTQTRPSRTLTSMASTPLRYDVMRIDTTSCPP